MGTLTDHALGRNLRFFVVKEDSSDPGGKYGEALQKALTGSNAAKVLSTSMEFTVSRTDRTDSRSTRSVLERITGKQEISWSCESYLMPRGGTDKPNIDPLIEATIGGAIGATKSISAATKANPCVVTATAHGFSTGDRVHIASVSGMTQLNDLTFTITKVSDNTFSLDGIDSSSYGTYSSGGTITLLTYRPTDANDLPTLRMARTANGVLREDLFGAYCDEMTISVDGASEPRITFSGGAFNYALTGTGAADGAGSGVDALSTHSGEGVNFMVGSVITLNGAERTILAKTGADALTLSASHSWDNDAAITPSTYTEVTHGSPINGITGSLTLNSVELPVTAFDCTFSNQVKALSDEAFEKGTSDFVAGFRTVTGTVTVRARKDFLKSYAARYVQTTATADPTFASVPLVVSLGSTSGKILKVHFPTVELDFGAVDIPESDEAVLNIPFTALGSSGGDEFLFSWNQTS